MFTNPLLTLVEGGPANGFLHDLHATIGLFFVKIHPSHSNSAPVFLVILWIVYVTVSVRIPSDLGRGRGFERQWQDQTLSNSFLAILTKTRVRTDCLSSKV